MNFGSTAAIEQAQVPSLARVRERTAGPALSWGLDWRSNVKRMGPVPSAAKGPTWIVPRGFASAVTDTEELSKLAGGVPARIWSSMALRMGVIVARPEAEWARAVSYTHLTLPTNREV